MPITVSCNNPPGGVVGTPYTHSFTSDDASAIVYIFPGILPSGLTATPSPGSLDISGTPDTVGWSPAEIAVGSQSKPLTVTAFNGSEYATTICGLATYLNCLPLTPSCDAPPGGTIAIPYAHSLLVASGGIAPFTFSLDSGALPDGLTMDGSGNITGTPTTNGLFFFTVMVTGSGDPLNNVATFSCSISIGGVTPGQTQQLYYFSFGFLGPLDIGCGDPPVGVLGIPYQHLIPIVPSGAEPYTFDIPFGALPDGLSIDPATGEITGTPTMDGTFNFTVRVTDDDATEALAECSITITAEGLEIIGMPPDGEVGVPYTFEFTPSGGTPPYAFSGDFCPGFGITFGSDGVLSGTPLLAATCCFDVTLTDDDDTEVTEQFCVTFRGCLLPEGS